MPTCPICASSQTVKNGRIHNGKQRLKCLDCGRPFIEQPTKKAIDFRHTGTDRSWNAFLWPESLVQHRFLNNGCFLEVNEKYAKEARSVQVTPKKRGGASVSMRWVMVIGRKQRQQAVGAVGAWCRQRVRLLAFTLAHGMKQQPANCGNSCLRSIANFWAAYAAVLRPLSDSKTSYRRAIQRYIEATGVSASPKNLVLFKIVGESHWCHLVFHSSLQCIITCVALPILCAGF